MLSAIMIAELKEAIVLPCFIAKSCSSLHRIFHNILPLDVFVKGFVLKNQKKVKKCDSSKTKVGFEIPMTRYFCEYQKQESAASFTTTFLQGGEIVVKEVICTYRNF